MQCVGSMFHRKDYNHMMATINNINDGHGNYRISFYVTLYTTAHQRFVDKLHAF